MNAILLSYEVLFKAFWSEIIYQCWVTFRFLAEFVMVQEEVSLILLSQRHGPRRERIFLSENNKFVVKEILFVFVDAVYWHLSKERNTHSVLVCLHSKWFCKLDSKLKYERTGCVRRGILSMAKDMSKCILHGSVYMVVESWEL